MQENTRLKGQVWKTGNDIDTDLIIAARYLNTSDPKHLAEHCLEDVFPTLKEEIKPGDILVAGRNFGCGSSREHAPIAIKHAGFSCVIAESFARIFYRNAINIGLPIIVAPALVKLVEPGWELEVDPVSGLICDITNAKEYQGDPFPPFILEILTSGGLVPYIKKKVNQHG